MLGPIALLNKNGRIEFNHIWLCIYIYIKVTIAVRYDIGSLTTLNSSPFYIIS